MADLEAASRAIPADRFGERPEPGEWSGNEVMSHVVAAGAYFGGGIVAALDDAPPPPRLGGAGAENAPARPAAEWCRLLSRDRAALSARVPRAARAAALDRCIEHGMFGPLNWHGALLFLRLHDLAHAGQLKKIAAALAAARPA